MGGRGRLARPHLPRSATCKQALGGRRLLQPRVRLGLGTGNWGLRLGAAHPAQSRASAAPSSTCLLPALVPSQGTVSSHTPPFPLPAPRYCIVRCVRAAPSGKAPTAPRSFCPLVHLAAPPSLSKAERRNALETHQTHLGMAENRTQLGIFFFFLNYTTLAKIEMLFAELETGSRGGRARREPRRDGGAGVAPTSARAWARYPQPRSSRQAQVLIASRGAGSSAGRRGRGAGAPAGLLWRRNSVPSLRERGPEEGGAESREPAERARRELRVQSQRGGGGGTESRREPPGPPGRGWGRKGRRAGAGLLPWCVPRAGRRRARSPSLALGATRPVNPHICCRQPREGTTERDCSSRRTTDHLSGRSARYRRPPRFSLKATGSPESLSPGLPLAAAAPGRARRGPAQRGPAACVRPSAARPRLRRGAPPSSRRGRAAPAAAPPGSNQPARGLAAPLARAGGRAEGRAGVAAAAAAAAAGRPEKEVEKEKEQAGRAPGVERAPQDARVEPAGDREGVIAPPPRPSPSPAPRLPRIPARDPHLGSAQGSRGPDRARPPPPLQWPHTRSRRQLNPSKLRARGSEPTGAGALGAPLPRACPPFSASCNPAAPGGEGRRPLQKHGRLRLASLSGPSGSKGQRPELLRQKGHESRSGPRPALGPLPTVPIQGSSLPLSIKGGGVSLCGEAGRV